MTDFRIIRIITKGTITIKQNVQYNNIQAERVTVNENITARLYGSIHKSLVLKKGSKVYLHGTLNGEIINEGGELILFK